MSCILIALLRRCRVDRFYQREIWVWVCGLRASAGGGWALREEGMKGGRDEGEFVRWCGFHPSCLQLSDFVYTIACSGCYEIDSLSATVNNLTSHFVQTYLPLTAALSAFRVSPPPQLSRGIFFSLGLSYYVLLLVWHLGCGFSTWK